MLEQEAERVDAFAAPNAFDVDTPDDLRRVRDWLTLLHPPYTVWHLSYVAIGAAVAGHLVLWRLGGTLLAFFLAVGIGAHALDELHGRPLRTAERGRQHELRASEG